MIQIKIVKLFWLVLADGQGFFRFFGHPGLAWKNVRKHPLLFSERNGFCKRVQIRNWSIKLLWSHP